MMDVHGLLERLLTNPPRRVKLMGFRVVGYFALNKFLKAVVKAQAATFNQAIHHFRSLRYV
jgi:hypothetical protein